MFLSLQRDPSRPFVLLKISYEPFSIGPFMQYDSLLEIYDFLLLAGF